MTTHLLALAVPPKEGESVEAMCGKEIRKAVLFAGEGLLDSDAVKALGTCRKCLKVWDEGKSGRYVGAVREGARFGSAMTEEG